MNTLEAYKEAYQTDAKYVYLIEDDVFVLPDFFRWHEAVQEKEDLLCSVAYRCRRNPEADKLAPDVAGYITSARDYASIGVCWRREKLAPVIAHAKEEYYRDLKGYLAQKFPQNGFSDCWTEQDGLIMRVLHETGGSVGWSCSVPRCYHYGVASYNRPRGPRLEYLEIKEMIHNENKIRQYDRDFGDIEAMPVTMPHAWTPDQLYKVAHFE